ncbi:starch binding domain containing protein [Cryptosporidium canis]|uniref:Starch binding domain containing protein n=1 Tax=Cryptosporidium canis TaxID=195482 RepID=A0ABQ8PAI8_9CRYT|nr:starch binding domain containing protein [Cryptosporidium canis]KAJ1612127.1 starch binding domain containing protein [Cryptosporidium canis]
MEQSRRENTEEVVDENRLRIRRLYEKRLHDRKLRIYEEALEEAIRREKMNVSIIVKFGVKFETKFGQELRVVGNIPELGNWNVDNGVTMRWTEGSFWTASISIIPKTKLDNIEYKYVLTSGSSSAHTWEPGKNHSVQISSETLRELQLTDAWGGGGLY